MTFLRSHARSPYMEWAKLRSGARFNLATSGMAGFPLSELGITLDQLEINGPSIYGYEPLSKAIAARYRVPQECVVTAAGTAMANYLAMAATTEPEDEVLIEQPTYELLLSTAQYLGLNIKRFSRPAERDFQIDLEGLERNLSSRTRLIVICNLHNPSGAFISDAVLRKIGELARNSGAYVVVDEVYREMLFSPHPDTAFHLDQERFLITDSLTKAYGLSGLRCGWVLASPELAERMWRINDLHVGTDPYPTQALSVIAFEKLAKISSHAKARLDENRKLLKQFFNSCPELDVFWPEHGTVVFPHLRHGNVDEFCSMLRTEFDVSVVPGRFFESPDHFRLGVGGATDSVRDSLAQLGRALMQYCGSGRRNQVPASRS